MLTYLDTAALNLQPILKETMFRDRVAQFRDRLNWPVTVDRSGYELDEYDTDDTLYVIWKTPAGNHGGSMRVMPTTGPCMYNDHFQHAGKGRIAKPDVWESTRFCLSPHGRGHNGRIAAALMLAGCEIGLNFGLSEAVGVFDPRMERIYKAIGWAPRVLGRTGQGRDRICTGVWQFSETTRHRLAGKAGLSPEISRHWFRMSFGLEFTNVLAA